jgi:hypothetical protein
VKPCLHKRVNKEKQNQLTLVGRKVAKLPAWLRQGPRVLCFLGSAAKLFKNEQQKTDEKLEASLKP